MEPTLKNLLKNLVTHHSKMKVLLFFSFIYLANCSTWRSGFLSPSVSFTESGKKFLIYQVKYEETNSWNPMIGTTDKKNFESRIQIHELINGDAKMKQDKKFPFWIFPNSVFYSEKSEKIYFVQGTDKGYGTADVRISSIDSELNTISPIWKDGEKFLLMKILPSPDFEKIALILSTDVNASEVKYFIEIIDSTGKSITKESIAFWFDSPEYAISWEKDSNVLFIRMKETVSKMELKTKGLKQIKLFPECFTPGTSMGSGISLDKKSLQFTDIQDKLTFKIIPVPEFIPYPSIKKSGSFAKFCSLE
ncbi:MAG: hypothetical protein SFU98_17095 [Leptospiraceae bacterium]|nr:hypothetical protein [Leptospiraceae bacterium]